VTSLFWTNGADTLDLNSVEAVGHGLEALPGATGFGLPPVAIHAVEGAGDGAGYRSSRTTARDFDIPISLEGRTKTEFDEYLSRYQRMLAGPFTMGIRDKLGRTWTIPVVRVGGGDHSLGDEEECAFQTVVTVRAHDPYWVSESVVNTVLGLPVPVEPFVGSWMKLPLVASQSFGRVQVNNAGDVRAYPTWTFHGPGNTLNLTAPTGETMTWLGTLLAGQSLIVDMRSATVVDDAGANRFSQLVTAPNFWALAPGLSTISASMEDADYLSGSRIVMSFNPRKWMVI
jgi:hypothetical protein